MVAILISTEFGGVGLIRGKALINGGGGGRGGISMWIPKCAALI